MQGEKTPGIKRLRSADYGFGIKLLMCASMRDLKFAIIVCAAYGLLYRSTPAIVKVWGLLVTSRHGQPLGAYGVYLSTGYPYLGPGCG